VSGRRALGRVTRIIHEIHHRSLWQVLGIYLFGAWIALQVVDVLANAGGLPAWVPTFALALLILGLPVVLATAVVQEGAAGATSRTVPRPERTATASAPATGAQRLLTWRNAILVGVGAFAVWGLAAAGWLLVVGVAPASPRAPAADAAPAVVTVDSFRGSVAVLPFDNLGADDDDFLSEGLTEELIATLAQVPGLKVISRTSVVALRGAALTLPEVADTLGVAHVLEGSVRRAGTRARITVQLIEAATDAHLWARSYTRELVDLFQLQEEIAREVSAALVQAVPDLRSPAAAARVTDTDAYEALLRGRQLLHRRTGDAVAGAVTTFERVVAADPGFAPAYASLAAAYALWSSYGHAGAPDPYTAYSRALAHADRAILLDRDAAAAYAARGYVLTRAWAPLPVAEADFHRALALQPSSADTHGWYAHLLVREHRYDEGLAAAARAIELDPVAPGRRVGYAVDALAARRYADARREARHAHVLEPGLVWPRALEAMAALLMDDPAGCLDVAPRPHRGLRAACLHSLGRHAEAAAEIDAMVGQLARGAEVEDGLGPARIVADVTIYYAWTGRADEATRWLSRSFQVAPDGVFRYVDSGLFDNVLHDPRFAAELDRARAEAWTRIRDAARPPG
jgi:TolB-like protein